MDIKSDCYHMSFKLKHLIIEIDPLGLSSFKNTKLQRS